ncbi:MAG: HAD family hydrolase [Bacteroidota bacterium]|nr:HAD family hydrolase [Bacteroidota bacterium]
MTKKAIIFDLDNTIYSAPSICDDLFLPLYQLIQNSNDHQSRFELIKQDMLRKPFHWVAHKHGFSETLTQKGIQLLETMTYDKPMQPFADYAETKPLPHQKFLVTTGFTLLQWSKIKSLNIENDFAEIHVVDITVSTKKEVFADIIKRYRLETVDILVVGDDLQSEIEAAQQLGIDAVLYDKFHLHQNLTSLPIIDDYKMLVALL